MKGSLIGKGELLKLFPNFKEDIGGNGIDLRVGTVSIIVQDNKMMGCVDDEKYSPTYHKINPKNDEYYELLPNNFYFITVDREIYIPTGYCQTYLLRSTFCRCGLFLTSAVGDDSFNGTLMMGLYNASPQPIHIGKNERVIQALTWKTDNTSEAYDGDYLNDKFYEEK